MNIFEGLAASMAFENNLTVEQAANIVGWLDTEGCLDYDILKEVYVEAGETGFGEVVNDNETLRPTFALVVDNTGVANDA